MSKITTFVRSVIFSIFNPAYYADIRAARSSFSWQYFLLFQALFAILVSARIVWPLYQFDVDKFTSTISSVVPSDLAVHVENGRLEINQPLPFRIAVPKEWQDGEMGEFSFVTFVDEEAVSSARDVLGFNSFAVITPTTAYLLKDLDTNELRAYPIPEGETVDVTANQIEQFRQKVMQIPVIKNKWYVPVFGAVLWMFVYPFSLVGRAITIALYSIVIVLVGGFFFKKVDLKYNEAFRLGLHAITPVIVLSTIADWVLQRPIMGWMYFGVYLLFMVAVLMRLGASQAVSAPVVKTEATAKRKSHSRKAK